MSEQSARFLGLPWSRLFWGRLFWRLGEDLRRLVRLWLGLFSGLEEEHNSVVHISVRYLQELLCLDCVAARNGAKGLDLLGRHVEEV